MASDVFISHSTRDRGVAQEICRRFDREGIGYWLASPELRGGDNWMGEILGAVQKSRMLVVVYSSSANASPHVVRELAAAYESNKAIVPFRVEDAPMGESLSYTLALSHFIDAWTPPLDVHLGTLVRAVRNRLARGAGGPAGLGAPAPGAPPAAYASLPSRKMAAVGALLQGDYAGAADQLRGYLALTPGDPFLRLALGIALSNGMRLDQLAYPCAIEMHRQLAAAYADPRTEGVAALALLALILDYFAWNGVSPPPPGKDALLAALRSAELSPAALRLVQQLPATAGTRRRLGL
ncbi:MAG TPA: toll/interleukin-1 receptor domain-containing protein [Longimicrobiaceae bacterium]|nr:toll/interleukin-1 receptor domain-containing protein [Longimicrobiaceae bacterium]